MDAKEARAYARSSAAYPQPVQRQRGPLIIFGVAAFIFFTIFFSTSSVQEVSSVAKNAAQRIPAPRLPSFPEFHNPFRSSTAHEPPVQKNSSSGDARWFSDWNWLNPFSSSVTFDDTRSVLPPLKERPPIYTYYDVQTEKEPAVVAEEKRLLNLWRKAWWAQGFKPIILGRAEAMKNPLYEPMQGRKLEDSLKNELMRWLAWGHMGTGILANWLAVPMGPRNDDDLRYLRRGQYPQLTRYETFGNGLFLGTDTDIDSAIKAILGSEGLEEQKLIWEAIPDRKAFHFEPKPAGIAFYDMQTLRSTYVSIADEIQQNKAQGLASLQQLITSHLHSTFLSQYPEGIAVLNSQGLRSSIITGPSIILANSLNTCPKSPLPSSCPPNSPKCKPCGPVSIEYPPTLSNSTKLFTIGAIPHPYTLSLLIIARPEIEVSYVRREQERDVWLLKVTTDTLDSRLSAYERIVTFKDNIANDKTAPHSLWRTAEHDIAWKDLEWHFGFSLPIPEDSGSDPKEVSTIKLPTPTSDDDPSLLKDLLKSLGTKRPTRQGLVLQAELVKKAREVLAAEKFKGPIDMRKVVEAWHLADTEAWRFVRALEAREQVERHKWEEEEKRFIGPAD